MLQRSEAHFSKIQPPPYLSRARTRASSVFRVFAFTSSPFGRISLKTSALQVKASPFAKPRHLTLNQLLKGEGENIHLDFRKWTVGDTKKKAEQSAPCHGSAEGEGRNPKARPFAFTRNTL